MKRSHIPLALLSAFTLATGLVASARAETFKLPDKHPVISVTYPDAWKPSETDRGVEGQTPDSAIYMAVEASKSEKGMNEIIDGTFDMFKEHKVVIDKDSKKTNKMQIAGEDAEEMLFTGKDEDGPAAISITTFTVGDTVIVISYWSSTDEEVKHRSEIAKIVSSIKELGK